jgi:hypothetical protein
MRLIFAVLVSTTSKHALAESAKVPANEDTPSNDIAGQAGQTLASELLNPD